MSKIITGKRSSFWKQFLRAGLMIFTTVLSIAAQPTVDPNPDSPTPILISEINSIRALATAPGKNAAVNNLSKTKSPAFPLYSKAVIYITNINLLDGEDASAFRVYAEDAKGRTYRFPVLQMQPVRGRESVHALTVELRDELGFWEQPTAKGDVLISVTWRGLASNRLRLGLGKIGGVFKNESPTTNIKFNNNTETPDAPDYFGYRYSGDRIRFLEQATFGPTTALDDRVRRLGLRVWLAEQFDEPYPTFPYPDFPLMPTEEPGDCNGSENPNTFPPDPPDIYPNCRRDRYTMYPMQNWFFKEAFYGNAQLKHRVAWALSQMWVISGLKTQQASHFAAYHKVLSRNAFGNYRTLMQEMTLNAGMGNYLDMVRSVKVNQNENYAREVLQLFTIGLFKMNQNGTLQFDAENNPIPTYDQNVVDNFAKVFTGWTFCETPGAACPNKTFAAFNYIDPMLLNQTNHNVEAKTLLDYPNAVNRNIAANLDGNAELSQALDNIYNHPNVAPFVSRFLIQHLVTSDPTPAYVGRISAVFNINRTSPTQLKEVVRAILFDPEARGNVKTDPNYGKLREPVQLATNLLRQFKVQSADGTTQSDGYIAQIVTPMAQNVFYSPTVFNFYAPDYIVPGPGLNGPEFAIMTTGTAISRINFINTIIFNRVNTGTNTTTGTSINLAEMQDLAAADATGEQMLDALNTRMMHGTMTEQNRNNLRTALAPIPVSESMLRVQTAIYLLAASSKYQVQR
jgi:uncharacterized protein (DUF1800 family)